MRKKAILLVPLTYNDGSRVPKKVINDLLHEVWILAGGHHVAGRGRGTYTMKSGDKQVDLMLEVWIAFAEAVREELEKLIKRYCRILDQESMYFEVLESEVNFLEPDDEKDGGPNE